LDGQAYRISEGPLATAIRASSSISPIIKPILIDDKLYCDGGIRANLPASAARETGADIVIAVLVDEPLQRLPAKRFKHLAGIASRLTDIILAVSDERQLQFSDIVINPDVSGVAILSKNGQDIGKAELAGEIATRKALPVILKKIEEKKHHPDRSVAATNSVSH
jgi:NTE family protein